MSGKQIKNFAEPIDHCDLYKVVEILLQQIKDCLLNEKKKSTLVAELNVILQLFQKRPETGNIFETDLLEWRSFLKQSKGYMDFSFDKKMSRTKRILGHLLGKPNTSVTDGIKKKPYQPTYYQILFRPGIRSIRQYPIDEEHYGEQNSDIDNLLRLASKLREEIIFAPHTKISRETKATLLDLFNSIVEICAYDVLDGVLLLHLVERLLNCVVNDEENRKKHEVIDIMLPLVEKLKANAKCHWMQGECIKKNMWNNTAQIEKNLILRQTPKFSLNLLAKSNFLRTEKIKEKRQCKVEKAHVTKVVDAVKKSVVSIDTVGHSEKDDCVFLTVPNPPNSPIEERRRENSISKETIFEDIPSQCESCAEVLAKYGSNIIKCMYEPDENFRVDVIPDAEEEETLFQMKKTPNREYEILRRIKLPTAPQAEDTCTPLKEVVRIDLGKIEGSGGNTGLLHTAKHPYLHRKRLLKC